MTGSSEEPKADTAPKTKEGESDSSSVTSSTSSHASSNPSSPKQSQKTPAPVVTATTIPATAVAATAAAADPITEPSEIPSAEAAVATLSEDHKDDSRNDGVAQPASVVTPIATTASTTPAEKQSPEGDATEAKAESVGTVTVPTADAPLPSGEDLAASQELQQDDNSDKGATQAGKCKWFDSRRGFGFITPNDGSDDVFVHQQCIVAEGFRSLREGEQVEYKVQTDDQGRKKAVCISGPGGAPVQGEAGGGFYRGRGAYQDGWYGSRGGYSRRGGGPMGMSGHRMMGSNAQRGQHQQMPNRRGMYQGYDMDGGHDFSYRFQYGAYGMRNYNPVEYGAVMPNSYGYLPQPGVADYPHYYRF